MRVLLTVLVALTPGMARSQVSVLAVQCAPYTALVAELSRSWGEIPTARGLDQSGAVIELLSAADGTSWTIVLVDPQGIACIATHGRGWRATVPGRAS
jgi:hypothetical protein